jgi:hypothetical protein
MKQKLILHLGLAKTGTTTIQMFLRQNPAGLAAAGIIYPKIRPDTADGPAVDGQYLTSNIQNETNHVALALEIQRRDKANAHNFETPLWNAAFQAIDESKADAAILSYENFAISAESFRFDILATALRKYHVIGIVYSRPQEDWVVSLYGQSVRGRLRIAVPMGEFNVFRRHERLEFSSRLDVLRNRLALDELIVANFEHAVQKGLLQDFLIRSGLPYEELLCDYQPASKNESLPHWATLFLVRCNQGKLSDIAFREVSRSIRHLVNSKRAAPDLQPGLDTATPEQRVFLRALTDADADRLMRLYGVALTINKREMPPYRPFGEDDFQSIMATLLPLLSKATCDALKYI